MQIGNTELDLVFHEVMFPAIQSAGLLPVRIDKHNEGRLLKSEIVEQIQKASIIIADLTNERPNCYLEVGYAMGLDKFNNLILTAREDHYFDNPDYKKGGPKIHFDLSGYDILFWDQKNLDKFKSILTNKIKRRLLLIQPKLENRTPLWNPEWLAEKREYVESKIIAIGSTGYMEVRSSILSKKINVSQSEILDKVNDSLIDFFGWPIGIIFLEGDIKAIPKSDGIESDLLIEDNRHYDYSYYKKNGQVFSAISHAEDMRNNNFIFRGTRIIRVTEVFMFLARYYKNIGLSFDDVFELTIRHTGLKGRSLKEGFNYETRILKRSNEDETEVTLQTTIGEIESNLVELVAQVIDPLLILFDFDKIGKEVLASYVNRFINGNR